MFSLTKFPKITPITHRRTIIILQISSFFRCFKILFRHLHRDNVKYQIAPFQKLLIVQKKTYGMLIND